MSREVDIYLRGKTEHDSDLIIEVKNLQKTVAARDITSFLALKAMAQRVVGKSTGYVFYSENGFTSEQETRLLEAGVMYSTGQKLTSYEAHLDQL